ncbi:MAG: chemotaxis protein CheW [Deltaproteobacteria bacterium]|nr:chemotaxis protein CheW [Deltaproteobacteria bacterium]
MEVKTNGAATEVVSEVEPEKNLLQLVTFHVGREEYAVDILRVQEIIRVQEMTRVPNTPDYLKGVINLRGKIIPVMDLRRRFRMEAIELKKEARIVVVEESGKNVGLMVDSMSEVLNISNTFILAPPDAENGSDNNIEFIQGVAKLEDRLLIFLNLQILLGEHGL